MWEKIIYNVKKMMMKGCVSCVWVSVVSVSECSKVVSESSV